MTVYFKCLGGSNHGHGVKYQGHEIVLPEKRPFEQRFFNEDGNMVSEPLYNESYTYRQFGIDRDTTYGFYALKELTSKEAMAIAGIVEVPPRQGGRE